MIGPNPFAKITAADAIVRSAYQMGKTPLLPLYAASLGAGDAYLGFIVSISTLTGMLTKPFFGVLSDRWGRRSWLIIMIHDGSLKVLAELFEGCASDQEKLSDTVQGSTG